MGTPTHSSAHEYAPRSMLPAAPRVAAPRARAVLAVPGPTPCDGVSFFHQPVPVMRLAYAILVALLLAAAPTASAQYLRIGDIEGESTTRGYEKWIDLFSFDHALTRAVQSGRTTGAPVHAPIALGKQLDAASLKLIEALNTGQGLQQAEIAFVRPADRNAFEYLNIELKNVFVTYHGLSVGQGGESYEQVDLVYEEITWTYRTQRPDGSPGPEITTTYNVVTNTNSVAALSAFAATPEGDAVVFRWKTSGQHGIYGFELQKREAGGFARASYVPGAGFSGDDLDYELRVRGLEKGIHTFRLAVLGVDGAVAYSDEVDVALGVPAGLDVVLDAPHPNPFSRALNLRVAVARAVDARIVVVDVLGREVAVVYEGPLVPGAQQAFTFTPPPALASGLYAVRVEGGGTRATRLVTLAR